MRRRHVANGSTIQLPQDRHVGLEPLAERGGDVALRRLDGEVEDANTQIAYKAAIEIEPDFEVGEEVSQEIKFEDFGRRNILSLRQNLIGRILELEKDILEITGIKVNINFNTIKETGNIKLEFNNLSEFNYILKKIRS